jgi:transposase
MALMGIANRVKIGGEDSAFALCLYLLLPVLLLGSRDLAAQSPPANTVAKVLVVAVLLFSLAASLSKFAPFPRLLAGLPDNPHEAAYRYLKRHPGRAYFHIGQEEVCEFLRHPLRHLRGPVIALLDNSRTHQGEPLHKLQRQHPRLRIEHFPSYAPELNPDEGVWSLAKRELAHDRPDDLDELLDHLIRSIESIRRSPAKLRGYILQSELPPFLR